MNLTDILLAAKLAGGGGGSGADAVRYSQQSLTAAQKAQARDNIGAVPQTDLELGLTRPYYNVHHAQNDAGPLDEIVLGSGSVENRSVLYLEGEQSSLVEITGVHSPTRADAAATKGYVDGTSVTVSGASPSIEPADNTRYNCGTLTSLTITNPPATGAYVIKFNSGSTATTTTIPSSIHGLESFAAEANTHYEINVEDNYAVIGKWAVSA